VYYINHFYSFLFFFKSYVTHLYLYSFPTRRSSDLDYFINAVLNGEEDLNYLDTLERHNKDSKSFIVHESWKNKVDFIGVDYYRRVYVHYSHILALSPAKFVGGSLINNLHSRSHNQPHGILNDL